MRFSAIASVLVTMSLTNAMDSPSRKVSTKPQSKGTYYSDDSDFMNQFKEPVSSQVSKPISTSVPTAIPYQVTGTPAPIKTPTPVMSSETKMITSAAPSQTALSTGIANKNTTTYKTSLDASGAVDLSIVSGLFVAMAIGQLFVLL